MSLETKGFEFGDFFLNLHDNVLLRDNIPVAVTPKAFRLLYILVINHHRLIDRDELMREVWADSFVEEGNLTFTIRLLRKALDDNPQSPLFIETVSRRGYRFVAEVKEVFVENGYVDKAETGRNENNPVPIQAENGRKLFTPGLAAGILLLGLILASSWYAWSRYGGSRIPLLTASFSSEKLSTDGKVFYVTISPDGKNAFYINRLNGKQALWLRQLESANNIEIIPAADFVYGGIGISPDGNFLYFSRIPKGPQPQFDIYRISIFGGVPQKLINETQGWVNLSPDGKRISFVRCYYLEDENCSLWIADADGKNEKKLVSRPRPFRISDNDFSPDGKKLVFGTGRTEAAANEYSLMEFDLENGTQRELTKEKFFDIRSLVWLPDQSGLILAASKIPNKSFRLWHVLADSGKVESLTNDSETYSSVSIDKAADKLLVTTLRDNFRLNLFNLETPIKRQVLVNALTAGFTADGRLLFSSVMSGNEEIWSLNPDGYEQKQLTSESSDDSKPVASPDNRSIYFASNRTGTIHVWRMNTDGSNQVQLTHKDGGFPTFASPDGKWVYYQDADKALRRVSTDGETEELIINTPAYRFAISSDAGQVAFAVKKGADERAFRVVSLVNKDTISNFSPAIPKNRILDIAWMPDGKSLTYIQTDGNFENCTLWMQPVGGTATELFDLGNDEIAESSGFAVSPDGKSLVLVQGNWQKDIVLLKGLR